MIPLQMTRPGKHTKNDGKSPISMAVFNSELLNYQRVDKDKIVETSGRQVVFTWRIMVQQDPYPQLESLWDVVKLSPNGW